MIVTPGHIPGLLVVEGRAARDDRGYFAELWQRDRYAGAGMPGTFVQDNVSLSGCGVLRGLHLQHPEGQGKLVSTPLGSVFDVAVDVRVGSPTFGQWEAYELSDANHRQVFIPEGVAHGFLVLSEAAVITYKCTAGYAPQAELSVLWSDPDLAIGWPQAPRLVSAKDAAAPRLCQIPGERLPHYQRAAPCAS